MTNTRQDLASFNNLELAWRRLQTGKNYEYKELCGEGQLAFGWNLTQNLKHLSSEITEKIYKPVKASKYYCPKKSDLVRPITLLSIKDQIYYQAIVNLICSYKLDEIRQFRKTNIFGGFNVEDPYSIFFLSKWKEEYGLYKSVVKQAFDDRYKWLGKFDLASFYDIIDHTILIKVSSNGVLDRDLMDEFFQALQIWSQPQAIKFSHSHGIPQGPISSQVLADIYLHLLDKKLIHLCLLHDLKYFRYVDDIILMGKTKKHVKIGLIQLDIAARELALIPQSGKICVS